MRFHIAIGLGPLRVGRAARWIFAGFFLALAGAFRFQDGQHHRHFPLVDRRQHLVKLAELGVPDYRKDRIRAAAPGKAADGFEQSSQLAANQPIERDAVAFGKLKDVVRVGRPCGPNFQVVEPALDRQQPDRVRIAPGVPAPSLILEG